MQVAFVFESQLVCAYTLASCSVSAAVAVVVAVNREMFEHPRNRAAKTRLACGRSKLRSPAMHMQPHPAFPRLLALSRELPLRKGVQPSSTDNFDF